MLTRSYTNEFLHEHLLQEQKLAFPNSRPAVIVAR